MKIKSIKLKNFLSYDRLDFELCDNPNSVSNIYIISGINRDTSQSDDNSNGSGKSTLIGESISFNLFGKNLRGSSKKIKLENAIKFGEGSMINEVEYFLDKENILKIRREKARDGKNQLEILVDGELKSKRTKRLSENDIRDFIGIDPDVFFQTIAYYKDNNNLLAMNYGQRLDFFKKLVDLTIMDEYYQYCKKFQTENNNKLNSIKINRKAQEDIINAINSNDTKYQNIILEAIQNLKNELDIIEKEPIKSEEKYVEKLLLVKEMKEKMDSEINSLNNLNKIDKVKITELKRDINNFTKLKNTNCITCGQLVSGEYANSIIDSKSETINELNNLLKSREDNIENLSEKLLKIQDKENKLKKEIDNIKSSITIKKVKIQSLNKQILEKGKELDSVIKAINSHGETNEYLEKINKLNKLEEILNKKDTINAFWLENLAAKSPVRSAILRKHINILSDIFEYYLGKLFRNTIIGKIEIDDEGNIDILLKSGDYEVNYWNLSSGEKKRADIAILFALYTYVLHIAPNAPKFLILDEIFDSLDGVGKEYVTETIADIYNKYDIDIFIISHIDFPDIIFDKIPVKNILVIKENGSSNAEFL